MDACQEYKSCSSSSSESEGIERAPCKARDAEIEAFDLPPPPSMLMDEAAKTPAMRLYAHQVGMYSLHIYLSVGGDDLDVRLRAFFVGRVNAVREIINAAAGDLHELDQFHISLTRPVLIKRDIGDAILKGLKLLAENLRPLELRLDATLRGFLNENGARSFAAVPVVPSEPVVQIINKINLLLLKCDLGTFHRDPRPHVSFAWASGDILEKALLRESASYTSGLSAPSCMVRVDRINCRIGCKTHYFELGKR